MTDLARPRTAAPRSKPRCAPASPGRLGVLGVDLRWLARRWHPPVLAAFAAALCWPVDGGATPSIGSAAQGERLFDGRAPLTGRIRGHADDLPPASLRCINCHARDNRPAPSAASAATTRPALAATQGFGPVLQADWLGSAQVRRGGPPSVYTADRLCTALREGLDPNQVYMARNMPIYRIDERDCQHLWAFLTSQAGGRR